MLCERCKIREVMIKYIKIINDIKTEHNLYSHYAKEMDFGQYSVLLSGEFPLGKFFSDFLGLEDNEEENDVRGSVVCPTCGASSDDFVENSRFGCAGYHGVFGLFINDKMKQLQGSESHKGKYPKHRSTLEKEHPEVVGDSGEEFQGSTDCLTEIGSRNFQTAVARKWVKELDAKLKKAVRQEDYELTASYRDQIKELKRGLESMSKWLEKIDCKNPSMIYSHIRLIRNWDEYVFPSRMTTTQCGEMVEHLGEGLKGLKDQDGRGLSYGQLDRIQEPEKMTFGERRILNMVCVDGKEPSGLLLSADKSGGVVLGGGGHIRMRIPSPGLKLDELWQEADALDDCVNERFSHTSDERYGYLIPFPINVGTRLRACVVPYLPALFQVRKSQSIVADMSRFGAVIRGLYEEGSDNYGSLYEVSNQRILGQPEKEIMELVTKVAVQLNNQGMRARSAILNTQRLEREDEVCKSYDVLKYTRKTSEKDAGVLISQLMAGGEDGLMKFNGECSPYSLIIRTRSVNLSLWAKRSLDKDELNAVRAAYIRQDLPEIVQLCYGQNQVQHTYRKDVTL